jgi:hypothetical protein
MADLAELTGAGRVDIFDGYHLSPPDLLDMGECEKQFEAKHIAFARVAAHNQHPDAAEKIINKARDEIAAGLFAFGTPHFDRQAIMTQFLPFWIYLELRRHHPDITQEKAGELLRNHADPALAQDVVLELAGYSRGKKKPTTTPAGESPPTGTPSPAPCESSDSPMATSEGSPSASSSTPSASGATSPEPPQRP